MSLPSLHLLRIGPPRAASTGADDEEASRKRQAKQEELKTRNKAQKRDDLCEMLGRGC